MRNILIVGYPKSGNTWIGYLLSYYFNAPYYDAHIEEAILSEQISEKCKSEMVYNEGFLGDRIRPNQPKEIRSIIKSHALPSILLKSHPQFLSMQSYKKSDPLLMIIRDPKDIAVSYFYYNYFRLAHFHKRWSRHLPYKLREWFYRKFCFHKFVIKVATEWIRFNEEWLKHQPLIVRYENLLVDPVGEIKQITKLLGIKFYPKYANEAKEFCHISNLRKLEDKINMPGTRNERFFRRGKAGGWRRYFSKKLLKEFNQITGNTSEKLGY